MKTEQSMTLKDWILTIVLLFLPIVNIVMLIIWATDKQDPRNTFSKAYLIVSAGAIALVFTIYMLLFFLFLMIGIFAA
ncbi:MULTISPECIES: hypothetical protein [Sporosarcina]|uniref:Uncharacterized protein n=1 Tax=Sporosarcina contaminans TaxID=633403 RepID=A0ABW3U5L0_9BACL